MSASEQVQFQGSQYELAPVVTDIVDYNKLGKLDVQSQPAEDHEAIDFAAE
jgi:hypothetical protein